MKINDIKILDCTFRDGGYYNNWNFPLNVVTNHLQNSHKLGIEYVEVGFRFLSRNTSNGYFAFSDPEFVEFLNEFKTTKFSLMFNASDLILAQKFGRDTLNDFMSVKKFKEQKIDLVRIATHYINFSDLDYVIDSYKDSNIEIAINLMQVSEYSQIIIEEFVEYCESRNVNFIYFADSLGSLRPANVSKICKIIKSKTSIPFGIHAHDNLGLALINTINAIENGASMVDASICGMGRGAGNTILEELIEYLFLEDNKLNSEFLDIIENYFDPLKKRLGWGKNLLHFKTGLRKLHPTYSQELTSLNNISLSQKSDYITNISKYKNSNKFNVDLLWNSSASRDNKNNLKIRSNPTFEKNVIIIGPGIVEDHKKIELDIFLKYNKETSIVSLNYESYEENYKNILIDYNVTCSDLRILDKNNRIYEKSITPFGISKFYKKLVYSNKVTIENDQITLTRPNVLCYALSVISLLKPKNIIFIGFNNNYHLDDFEIIEKFIMNLNCTKLYTIDKEFTQNVKTLIPYEQL